MKGGTIESEVESEARALADVGEGALGSESCGNPWKMRQKCTPVPN
jgi:hypothetical protein